jgi:hypothetical protein
LHIFLDESGQATGFGKPGSSKTFNIALVVCSDTTSLKKTLKRFEKDLIHDGWPNRREIKAASLFNARRDLEIPASYRYKKNPSEPLVKIFRKLQDCDFEADYISVRKDGLTEALKSAPYGIIYNYLAGQVLEYRFKNAVEIGLVVDATNKEAHSGRHFDGYVQTKAFEVGQGLRRFHVQHCDSTTTLGLRVVDYISWSVYRKCESKDRGFYDLISRKFNKVNCREWFY